MCAWTTKNGPGASTLFLFESPASATAYFRGGMTRTVASRGGDFTPSGEQEKIKRKTTSFIRYRAVLSGCQIPLPESLNISISDVAAYARVFIYFADG